MEHHELMHVTCTCYNDAVESRGEIEWN